MRACLLLLTGSVAGKSSEGELSGADKGEKVASEGGAASEKGTESEEVGNKDDGKQVYTLSELPTVFTTCCMLQVEGPAPSDDPGSDMDTDTPSGPSPAHHRAPGPALNLPPPPPPPQLNFPPPPTALFTSPPMQIPLAAPLPQVMAPEPKGPRPIASIPVPGTPWSVVWSSDDRSFFFNATNRSSVWSTPDDLIGNEALEKILDHPPGGKSEHLWRLGTVCRLLYMFIALTSCKY